MHSLQAGKVLGSHQFRYHSGLKGNGRAFQMYTIVVSITDLYTWLVIDCNFAQTKHLASEDRVVWTVIAKYDGSPSLGYILPVITRGVSNINVIMSRHRKYERIRVQTFKIKNL